VQSTCLYHIYIYRYFDVDIDIYGRARGLALHQQGTSRIFKLSNLEISNLKFSNPGMHSWYIK
jgi:hypothetical protein